MPTLTKVEERKIVEEAISLLKEPANWVVGKWKCEVFLTDDKGKFIRDENGQKIPACDRFNRPQAAYCIEGAVNQAAINVLGETKASQFGVERESPEMTDLLGINEIARSLFSEHYTAMEVNDSFDSTRDREEGHKAVLSILQAKLKALRARRKKQHATV